MSATGKRRARIGCLLATASLALAAPGCSLSPWDPQPLPAIGNFEARVTAGLGTSPDYVESVTVDPGSTIQLKTKIGDGNVVEYSIPAGPAEVLEVGVRTEDAEQAEKLVEVRSRDGEPITLGDPSAFTPGYLGVENDADETGTTLRVVAPRLTGTPQGTVSFTFKLGVGP